MIEVTCGRVGCYWNDAPFESTYGSCKREEVTIEVNGCRNFVHRINAKEIIEKYKAENLIKK